MIALFSGTGNSLLVARELSEHLGDEIVDICTVDSLPKTPKRIIWIFPVYAWGLPPVVADFIDRQNSLADVEHWCVFTCGDDVGKADRSWKRAMHNAGANKLRGIYSVEMPNTYVCLPGFDIDSPELTQRKLEAMPARVLQISKEIKKDQDSTDVVRGAMPGFKSTCIYPVFRRTLMSPRPFHTTSACIGCGICARSCPLHNIEMGTDKLPIWGDNCTLCLRCYHICPQHAVARGRGTKGKGQKQIYQ